MHYPSIPLLCFLWAWLPLSHSQPLELDKILDDMESLTGVIIARIQEQQFPSVSMKIHGLDFIPEYFPSDSMRVIDATLGIFHQVLSTLPSEASVDQISNDIENLRSLLQLLAAELGCPYERSSSDDALSNLTDLLTISPYTTTIVTMDRLQKCLRSLPSLFRHGQQC